MTFSENPNHKGNVAELAIAAEATRLGVDVSRPMGEHTRYDLIFGIGDRLLRVQCKWALLKGEVIVVRLASSRYRSDGKQVHTTYTAEEIDAVAVYCEAVDSCYLIGIDQIAGMRGMHLRLSEAKNGQKASLNWAADYKLQGAVAQLGERRSGTPKATGSSPVSSTGTTIGAHEFRNLFGWYAQRAAAGERFLITRRGKPYVRLLPATDQLELAPNELEPSASTP